MKNLSKFFLGVFAVAILASCGGANGPEAIVKDYLTALKDKNYAKAKELGTKNTQDMLDALTQMNMAPEVSDVKDIKCTVEGNAATCTFCCMKEKTEIKLVKEGEKWLIDDKKEAPAMPETTEEAPADSAAATTEAPAEGAAK